MPIAHRPPGSAAAAGRFIPGLVLAVACTQAAVAGPWDCAQNERGLWECSPPATEPGAPVTPEPGPGSSAATPAPSDDRVTQPPPPVPTEAQPAAVMEPDTDTGTGTGETEDTTAPGAIPLFPTTPPADSSAPVTDTAPAASATGTQPVSTDTSGEQAAADTDTPAVTDESATSPRAEVDASHPPASTDASAAAPESPASPESPESPESPSLPLAVAPAASASALSTVSDINDSPIDAPLEYDRWIQCPPVEFRRVEAPAAGPGVIELQADNARAIDQNIFSLQGQAVAEMDLQRIEADQLTYNQDQGRIDADGNMRYTSPELLLDGTRGSFFPATDVGDVDQADYALPDTHARGTAENVKLDGRDWQFLHEVSYTTCAEGSNDWEIFAREVDLDQAEGRGVARDARVELKGVPVLYSPWLSFPLDDRRKTGFLVPKFGYTGDTGIDISTPWYWNIAPNRDATIVPRIMSDRGVMLGGEFRYKNEHNKGVISGEYLPSDREFNDEDRYLVGFQHKGNPWPRLKTSIKASEVSDDFYFSDFGRNLVQTSQTNLERTARADYYGRGWNLGAMVQNYQTINPRIKPRNRPYEQLPGIMFDMAPAGRYHGMKFDAFAELNNFRHSAGKLVDGTRFDVQPRISLPVNHPGWYVDPAVAVRYTTYNLTDNVQTGNDSPTRTTPVVSIDAGSFFERGTRWGNTDFVQTLEPRLFYLYVPEVDQDDIPIFDTSEYDFNYWTLFRENRFSGPDRMGDANQLAVALTSRLLNPASGVQTLGISIGSLLYFRDRDVTLPGEPVETDSSSNIIAELTLGLTHNWSATAETQWNPHESQTERNSFHLQYRKGSRQLVNLGYRYRRDIEEQVDISALWPLGNSWHLVGRWYYSIMNNELLETIAGVGYESCCWSAQLVGRSFIKSRDSRSNDIFFQVELKGLGRVVNTVDKVLERGILGYDTL